MLGSTTASFIGEAIWVLSEKDISFLLENGLFGKGVLSRGVPTFNSNEPTLYHHTEKIFHKTQYNQKVEGLEPLQLLFEEAFFLANKKMLTVLDNSGSAMSVSELWTALCEINPNISISFFVYNHYRNLGWIPKSGLKFGGDFILYDAGPDECHSKYILRIQVVDETGTVLPFFNSYSWQSIFGSVRLGETVMKVLWYSLVFSINFSPFRQLSCVPSWFHMVLMFKTRTSCC
eukprot:TRINITY_DN2153_c0_g1_i11.p1 TRINITY_DN2153_c0_g1~~TRINITY_DN2153_c0_g1_i11.p1  ORF type:complete len:232 (-),score=27.25 TRINITY_DN2153_c0_g1_i11:788-1483(-)